jgi:hypothetical protein
MRDLLHAIRSYVERKQHLYHNYSTAWYAYNQRLTIPGGHQGKLDFELQCKSGNCIGAPAKHNVDTCEGQTGRVLSGYTHKARSILRHPLWNSLVEASKRGALALPRSRSHMFIYVQSACLAPLAECIHDCPETPTIVPSPLQPRR